MPLINTSVPNLIQGVSQQPDASRFAGQCEEQENALSSVADGLKKRPNTRHVARLLEEAISENSFVHFIDRDDNEKYVVLHDGTDLRVFNIQTGVEGTINGASDKKFTPASGSYLDLTNPRENLKGLTVSDSTFLLNTSKVVGKATTRTLDFDKESWVFIKQGAYNATYTVNIESREGIVLNIIEYSGVSAEHGDPYSETRWIFSLTYSQDGYTPNSYLAVKNNYTSTPSTVFYVYIGDDGIAEGLSYTNGGDVVQEVEFHTNYDPNGDYYDGSWAEEFFADPTIDGEPMGLDEEFSIITQKSADDRLAAGSTNIISRLKTAGESSSVNISNYFDFYDYQNGLLCIPKSSENIGTGYTAVNNFAIHTSDSLSDTGAQALYKSAPAISDLPVTCKNGFRLKIIGDAELDQDDYYVEFQTSSGEEIGLGAWVEVAAPLDLVELDKETMPIRLINTAENTFELETISWDRKKAGDSDTNPFPSFIDNKINNMFLYKNRLGFLSNDNVVLSESGNFFNLFRTTVLSLLDSDPIDVSVSSRKVTNLKDGVGFQENLILFSDNAQFAMKGGDLLTPNTVSVTPITNFNFEGQVEPLALGSYIYFPFTRGAYSGLREFTINATSDTYDSVEVTEHVPAYIPQNIIDMAGTTTEDVIALLSGDETDTLYIYNYFWNNNQKVLSAWSKFTFTGEVRGMEFIESNLYAVITHNGETNLVEMPLESGLTDANGYVTHLDMRVSATVANGSSTLTLPYTPEDNSVGVYTDDGLKLTATNSGATVTLNQAVTEDTEVFVGIPYTMKYTFSEQLFKAKAGNGTSPSNAAKLMVRNGSIYFDDTAYFQVKVTPKARNTSVNTFTPDVVGSTTIGSLSLDSGFYRFPVFTKAQDTTITIENDSALPSSFQSAEFESFVHSRSNRYG
jgi:hypothetical protein